MQYTRINIICQYIGKYAILGVFIGISFAGLVQAQTVDTSSQAKRNDAINRAVDAMIKKGIDAAMTDLLAHDPKMSIEDQERARKIITDSFNYLRESMDASVIAACESIITGVDSCPIQSLTQIQADMTAMVVKAFNVGYAQGGKNVATVAAITNTYLTRDLAAKKFKEYQKFIDDKNISGMIDPKRDMIANILPKITDEVRKGEEALAKGKAARGGFFAGVGKFLGIRDVDEEIRVGEPRLILFQTTLALITDLDLRMRWLKESGIKLQKDMAAIQEAIKKPSLSPKEIQDVFARVANILKTLTSMENDLYLIATIVNRKEIVEALKDPKAQEMIDEYNKRQKAKGEPLFDWNNYITEVNQLEQSVNQDIKDKIAFLKSEEMKALLEKLKAALAVDIDIKKPIAFPLLPTMPAGEPVKPLISPDEIPPRRSKPIIPSKSVAPQLITPENIPPRGVKLQPIEIMR